MSRKFVRQTVAAFISPPSVAGLGMVFTAKPRQVDARDYRFGLPEGSLSGAIAYPIIMEEEEARIEDIGSSSSGKVISYRVQIALRFHSNQQDAQDAQDDYDDIVDAIKTRLRSDAYLGTDGSRVWFSSEDAFLTRDLRHRCTIPEPLARGGGTLVIWGSIDFGVAEKI